MRSDSTGAFSPEAAASWRRVRKYAVPRWMIEQATERRLAGDWQGACAAANVDVALDLADIGRREGATVAEVVEADLAHLAPDLLRWHLPRYLRGRSTIQPDRVVILARYQGGAAGDLYLYVAPLKMVEGPQRLTLSLGDIVLAGKRGSTQSTQVENWAASRHLWDARHVGELRERSGGGNRAPFHNADGTLRSDSELPLDNPGSGDPAAYTEWVTLLRELGEPEQAFGAAGITLDQTLPQGRYRTRPSLLDILARYPLAISRLEPEMRRLADAGFGTRFSIVPTGWSLGILLELGQQPVRHIGLGQRRFRRSQAGPVIRLAAREELKDASLLPEACWRPLPDLNLLRHGVISPEDLHPMVSASLFPGRAPQEADGPPGLDLPAPVRVRCRGEWHEVRSSEGRLLVPHTVEEERRERVMRAFGGPVAGCFAAQQAWTSGVGRLPRALRDQRREFFQRVQHGDTSAVLRLLDAGVDLRIRDGRQRTLLHLLPLLDWEVLLPRLLDAGLDIEARDHHQRTPLHVAVGEGPEGLVRALLDAGARTDVADNQDNTLATLIVRYKRRELKFLKDAVERDHPHLPMRYPAWGDLDE